MTLTSEPNYASHFIKYATTLYNEVPKSIQEAEKYIALVSKLERSLLYKTIVFASHMIARGETFFIYVSDVM